MAPVGRVEVHLPQPGSKVNEVPQSYYTVKNDPTRNRTMEQEIDNLHAAGNLNVADVALRISGEWEDRSSEARDDQICTIVANFISIQ